MNREEIEKVAFELCHSDNMNYNIYDFGRSCFIKAAEWRINSAWHTDISQGKTCQPILVKFKNGHIVLFGDIRDLKGMEDMTEAWACVSDLLPKSAENFSNRRNYHKKNGGNPQKNFSKDGLDIAQEEKVRMWVARDSDGELYLHSERPYKGHEAWINSSNGYYILSGYMFPGVKWSDDEPTEVELVIKK